MAMRKVDGRTCRAGQGGAILVAAVLTATVMLGFTYVFFVASRDSMTGATLQAGRDRLFYLAEGGIGEAIDSLNQGRGPGVVDRSGEAQWSYRVEIRDRGLGSEGQEVFQVSSTAIRGRASRTIDAVVEDEARPPVLMGAVESGGKCYAIGNTVIDGRDYDGQGLGTVGAGVNGIAAGGEVHLLQHPWIGGNGVAPIEDPVEGDGVLRASVPFGNGLDDDGDGAVDEEAGDAADNDGDGRVDEDLVPYEVSPDALFGIPDGTLKRFCQRKGTYFRNEADLESYLAASGGGVPGGVVLYLEDRWKSASFGSLMNEQPSILVVHRSDGKARIENLSGRFKGLIVTDNVTHLQGDVRILGGLHVLRRAVIGDPIGFSSAQISYSKAVLTDLPPVHFFAMKAWRDVPGAPLPAGGGGGGGPEPPPAEGTGNPPVAGTR